MYQTYWGLSTPPFASGLDVNRFHATSSHEEALARMQFLVEHHWRAGILLADAGLGKSMTLAVLARQLRRGRFFPVSLGLAGMTAAEFLEQLATQLGNSGSRPSMSPWRIVQDLIAAKRFEQTDLVFLFDDADEALSETLAQVDRLIRADQSPNSHFTVILSSKPDSVGKLGSRLLEQIELRIDLEPWELRDTEAFVKQSLAAAGRQTAIFAPDALERLHDRAGGIPRHVRQLAELALLAAAGCSLPHVDAHTIDSVHDELGVLYV
jgi:type II secretory pathway predicted ATPase ExeA